MTTARRSILWWVITAAQAVVCTGFVACFWWAWS